MLEDQVIHPSPLIGLGHAFFQSCETLLGVDYSVIRWFRNDIQPNTVFRFVFIDLVGHEEMFKTLERLGVFFADKAFIHVGNPASELYARRVMSTLDFVHSPVLSRLLNLSFRQALPVTAAQFLSCLAAFSLYPEPYSKDVFLKYSELDLSN